MFIIAGMQKVIPSGGSQKELLALFLGGNNSEFLIDTHIHPIYKIYPLQERQKVNKGFAGMKYIHRGILLQSYVVLQSVIQLNRCPCFKEYHTQKYKPMAKYHFSVAIELYNN